MLTRTEKISLSCFLVTLSLLLGYIETLFIFIPVPGIKVGISNLVVLYALLVLDLRSTYVIGVTKCLLNGLLFSGVTSIFYSIISLVCSVSVMFILKKKLYPDVISEFGISISGSSIFNIVQLIIASVLMKTTAVYYYMPIMILMSVFTGGIIAFIIRLMHRKIRGL